METTTVICLSTVNYYLDKLIAGTILIESINTKMYRAKRDSDKKLYLSLSYTKAIYNFETRGNL